jgi:glutamate dehydrogenase
MLEGFHSAADQATLDKALSIAHGSAETPKSADGALDPAFESFLSQLVRYATGEDRHWDEPQSLVERALQSWRATAARKRGEPAIALRIQKSKDWRETRLTLDIATDDMPFIVDSVTAALTELGKIGSFFVNAVVSVGRDAKGARSSKAEAAPESMIHVEMDPPVDDGEIEMIENEIANVLADTALAVADFEAMRSRLAADIAQLERVSAHAARREDHQEAIEFLKKLWDNKFTFLGVRRYRYSEKDSAFSHDAAADLGILRDNARRVLKTTWSSEGELSPAVRAFMQSDETLIITKANARSTVHRRVHMDYIGIKTFDQSGRVNGEDRFVGLLTSDIYNRPATDLPILRTKVKKVVEGAGFRPGGHNAKALTHILETFPRDEMLQSDIETLSETALGVLRLYKRPRAKIFLRRDRFERFVSAIVFVPRDRFSSSVREQIGEILARAYDGHVAAFNPHFGDAALVRVHFIIGIAPGAPVGPGVAELTRQIRAVTQNWSDRLLGAMREQNEGATPQGLFQRYENAFDAGYKERISAREALDDIAIIETMGSDTVRERVFRRAGAAENAVRLKLYRRGEPLPLSDLIPRIEHLGLRVLAEDGGPVSPQGNAGAPIHIHDFSTVEQNGRAVDIDAVKKTLADAFAAVIDGKTEDDGFNALVVRAGIDWREAWLIRAMAKYLFQAGLPYSQNYVEDALSNNAAIVREIIVAFHARFHPQGPKDAAQRKAEYDRAAERARALLDAVTSLDEDRILRRYMNLLDAMTRTNFYQSGADGAPKTYISFKLVSALIEGLPEPRPYREIFVCGPRVDGVHLRFGPVARGGLRWSDRREDFRTEVLGLVKAQRVKNAVIVPTGSKGGFYPKQLPQGGDRNAIFEEGREAYKIFIRGLLDITDNIVGGKTTAPANVVRWDDEDPYLVVAADKGTATFSDTANAISAEYGFWLGDAFASGGSAGYDHKVMGITARGGWEAVKRHFREIGKDIQTEPFTVAGIGDMSGDVFGNGMLLSEKIRLVAAFDHRDIFLDPDPDPAASFAERKRMFELPRSSWADYDKAKISKGGGVFSRASKSIALSSEAQTLLGLSSASATPQEVMKAILKLPVELLWLGGIGTYFKAPHETNGEVGDRANDSIRISANEMRMKVVGEGANLGVTQAGRIAFALAGGRINTDAIDNSAGVDSSDHEVNIKILVSSAIERGELKAAARNELLRSMTEDVAQHVLRHNYDQTRALTLMQSSASGDIETMARFMSTLEANGRLDRAVEGLPDDKQIKARRAQGRGLTRPELAVVLAYAKMELFEELVASTAPDDPVLERELFRYFPDALHGFKHAMLKHRLRREIIATRLSNEIVDTCGATYVREIMEVTGASFAEVALAYEAARGILNLGEYAAGVDALDAKVPAETQTALYLAAVELLEEQVDKIVSDHAASETLAKRGVKGVVDDYTAPIQALKTAMPTALPAAAAAALAARAMALKAQGAPDDLAEAAALMPALEFAFDIVNIAKPSRWPAEKVAALFFAVGDRFGIEQARAAARSATPEEHFDRLAQNRLVDELSARQGAIVRILIASAKEPSNASRAATSALLDSWSAAQSDAVGRYDMFVRDLDLATGVSIGKLSLLTQKLGELVDRTGA